MKTRKMTDAEREEIAEIERRAKGKVRGRLRELGPAYSAKHPRLS